MVAAQFLRDLVAGVPYAIHIVLTDNGIQFTHRPLQLLIATPDSRAIFLMAFPSALASRIACSAMETIWAANVCASTSIDIDRRAMGTDIAVGAREAASSRIPWAQETNRHRPGLYFSIRGVGYRWQRPPACPR